MLVYDHTPGGLLVARESASEETVRRALKQFDPRLLLDYALEDGRQVWQVLCRVNTTTGEARVVCRWRDEHGRPLPLSHGLVERVKQLHVESRAPKPDVLAENDRRRQRLAAEAEEQALEYAKDLLPRLRGTYSSGLHRGPHLRRRQFPNVTDVR